MGVVTTAYSVSPTLVKKIRKDNDVIGSIVEPEEGEPAPSFDFDTTVDAWISVLRAASYEITSKGIDSGDHELGTLEYDSYDIWLVPPAQVKAMASELEGATFAALKAAGLAAEVSDRRGTTLRESEYAGYFEDEIEKWKSFLRTAADQGHSLLFTEA